MFWNSKQKKGVVVLQEVLQDENDVFDILIIALEKLEAALLQEKDLVLNKTAMGSERDLSNVIRSLDGSFKQVKLQCVALNNCSAYDDKEVFNMAVKMFMKNLLEWYAGRAELNFFDEVDEAVIPVLEALVDSDPDKILSDFGTYVYKPSNDYEDTLDEKYNKVKSGFDAWIKAQHYFGQIQSQEQPVEKKQIFSHKRGEAVDGYIRVMKALTTMNSTSAPAKLLLQMVKEYLPEIVSAVPHINEEFIDDYFEKKAQIAEEDSSAAAQSIDLNKDIDQLYPLLYEKIKEILDAHNIKYSEVKIEVK